MRIFSHFLILIAILLIVPTHGETCKVARDCAWGCLCLREVCVSPLKLSTQQSKCPKCELTSGCTFPDICVPGLRICWSCFETFKKEVSAGCIKSNNTVTIPGTNIDLPVCVSTQWILERGLQHAVLRDSGAQMQPVLCIPDNNGDIPCGTPGHLLRDANTRKLVSYQTLCDKRRDCISTSMPVSQLSHNYDWSRYRTENYELTSLSAHPHAKTQYSPSRILAGIADMLNRAGMGRMCDAALLFMYQIREGKLPSEVSLYTSCFNNLNHLP